MATTVVPNPLPLADLSNVKTGVPIKIKEEPMDYIIISDAFCDGENNPLTIPMTVIEQEEIDNVLEPTRVPKVETVTGWDFSPLIPKLEVDEGVFKSIIEATPITGFPETGLDEMTDDERQMLVKEIEDMIHFTGKPSTPANESINNLSGDLEYMQISVSSQSAVNIIDSEGNHLVSRGGARDSRKAKQSKEKQKAVEKVLLWQTQNQQQNNQHQIQGPLHQQQPEPQILWPPLQQEHIYPATTTSQEVWRQGNSHAAPNISSNYGNNNGVYGIQNVYMVPGLDDVDSCNIVQACFPSSQMSDGPGKDNINGSAVPVSGFPIAGISNVHDKPSRIFDDLEKYRAKILTTKPILKTNSDVVADSAMFKEYHEPVSPLSRGKHQHKIDSFDACTRDGKVKRIENANGNGVTSPLSHMTQVATSSNTFITPDVFDISTHSANLVTSLAPTPRLSNSMGQFTGPEINLSQASPVSVDAPVTVPTASTPGVELAELEAFSTFTDVNYGTIYHVMVELYAEFKSFGQTTEANQLLQMVRKFSRVPSVYTRINDVKKNWETAVFLAVKKQCPELVCVLVNEGADVNIKAKFHVNFQVGTEAPLHYAAKLGDKGVPILEALLEAQNADVNIYNSEGETALHLALKEHNLSLRGEVVKSYKTVSLLLKYGADWVLQEYKSGKTALMLAIETKDMDMVRCMLSGNDDHSHDYALNKARDRGQNTCMHVAGALQGLDRNQHVTLVFMLLKYGGDADAESNDRVVAKMISPDIFRAAFNRMKGNTPCRLPSSVRSSSSDSVS